MFAKEGGKGLAAVWFKFFLDAGIPPSDAGNYAATFTEHRIQPDMLGELTKDYLADMGITVLGDVIAILKHARIEHAKMSKEQALKCSGLAVQPSLASSSLVDVPPATKTLPTTTKRTTTKAAAAATASSSGPVTVSSLQIPPATRNSARGTGVIVIDEPSKAKMPPAAAAAVTTPAVGAARGTKLQRPQEKQPVPANSVLQRVINHSLAGNRQKSSLPSSQKSTAAAVKSQPMTSAMKSQPATSVNDPTPKKSVVAVTSSLSSAASSKMSVSSSSVFSRLGDKLSPAPSPSLVAAASSAEKTSSTKTVRDRLGPATRDTGSESVVASVKPRLADSQSAPLIPTKRKLVGETVVLSTATDAAAAAAVPALSAKSSIKARLGAPVVEPATHDRQPRLMIPTKRKVNDETVSLAAAAARQAKTAKFSTTRLSVKSRLGEPATSDPQPKLKLATGRKLAAGDDNDLLSCVVLPQDKTVFSRLGRI